MKASSNPRQQSQQNQRLVILFDGQCKFCNGMVNFVVRRDPQQRFRLVYLQDEIAEQILLPHGLQADLSSVLLIHGDSIYHRTDAALEICKRLGGAWSLLACLKVVPRGIRDRGYDLFARFRYKLFGKYDTCMIPDAALKSRFLSMNEVELGAHNE